MRAKLGLASPMDTDRELIEGVLKLLAQGRVDYTIFWRRLSQHVAGRDAASVRDLFLDRPALDAWMARYTQRLGHLSRPAVAQRMLRTNPKYVLRNHLAETAIRKAADQRDYSEIERLMRVLARPYDEQPAMQAYAEPAAPGTVAPAVSCSS